VIAAVLALLALVLGMALRRRRDHRR
jgi:hypothetical protein